MDPQTHIWNAIPAPLRLTTIADVGELGGLTSPLVPDPARLALFHMVPIWGSVKQRVPVNRNYPASLPAGKPN